MTQKWQKRGLHQGRVVQRRVKLNPALVRNFISYMKALEANSVLFFLPTIYLMTECSEKKGGNYPGKYFWTKEKETQVKI